MLRILTLFIMMFFCFPSFSEVVTGEGESTHMGDIAPDEGCMIAEGKAKLDATQKVSAQTISVDEFEKCSEIDGISSCHRNYFFLNMFNAEIDEFTVVDEKRDTETLSNGKTSYTCNVKIKGNVVPINQITDPDFDFNVNFNKYNFNSGDNLEIEIGITQPMYLNIFQLLPWRDPKKYQAEKLFPNPLETNNYLKSNETRLPTNGNYKIKFPKDINKKGVVEYLLFIASKEKIEFLNKYTTIYDLKKRYLGLRNKVKFKHQQYTIAR